MKEGLRFRVCVYVKKSGLWEREVYSLCHISVSGTWPKLSTKIEFPFCQIFVPRLLTRLGWVLQKSNVTTESALSCASSVNSSLLVRWQYQALYLLPAVRFIHCDTRSNQNISFVFVLKLRFNRWVPFAMKWATVAFSSNCSKFLYCWF